MVSLFNIQEDIMAVKAMMKEQTMLTPKEFFVASETSKIWEKYDKLVTFVDIFVENVDRLKGLKDRMDDEDAMEQISDAMDEIEKYGKPIFQNELAEAILDTFDEDFEGLESIVVDRGEIIDNLKRLMEEKISKLSAEYDKEHPGEAIKEIVTGEAVEVPDYLVEKDDKVEDITEEKDLKEINRKPSFFPDEDNEPEYVKFIEKFQKMETGNWPVSQTLTEEDFKDKELYEQYKKYNSLFDIDIPEDLVDYTPPTNYEYLKPSEIFKELQKYNMIMAKRERLGLEMQPFFQIGHKISEKEREIMTSTPVAEQQEILRSGKEDYFLCFPFIYFVRDYKIAFCVNVIDKYVNVTRLLQYAHSANFHDAKNPKALNSWFQTKVGKLLMISGKDRFSEGVTHPYIGKLYKKNIRMGYRIAKRLSYAPCVSSDFHKGTYLHPRIAAAVAMWVSKDFHDFFAKAFEEGVSKFLEISWIESGRPRYATPALPGPDQLLVYRNKKDEIKYKQQFPGLVNISVGKKAYIKRMVEDKNKIVLYYLQSVPNPAALLAELKTVVNYKKTNPNKYEFGSERHLKAALEFLMEHDKYPSHLEGIWQDSTIRIDILGSYQAEKKIYDMEKKEAYLISIGQNVTAPKNKSRWLDEHRFLSVDIDGNETIWHL